ncbi:AraC family transcriptional regulator [Thalassomonas viridans]|uniref:AraC family transcriptional regulator n=1 Tax=Thalassomonas viridans TaxID=137584 RepID=A0AAE9Z835_9GAMM|nr:AraC family transcriptional regulator [Thalassomonas viridans]WDE08500.1 AraC family transcriptional regulator [Thalassomonas viridans]
MERFFKSIEFVERNLYDKFTIHEMAAASHYSSYHFSRIFKALVGDTPKQYVRKRRLTVAAKRLLTEDISIFDLAIDCMFDSQEAFTRAFKDLFNITPGQYRKQNDPFRLLYQDQFSPNMLHHLQYKLSMEPMILTQPAMKIVGIASEYREDDLDLFRLWSAFAPYKDKIPNQVGENVFGIYDSYQEQDDEVKFCYICAAEVANFDDVPQGMITREIPEQLYARFIHKGLIAELDKTLKYIWGSWLPDSPYEYVEKPDFELYTPNASCGEPDEDKTVYLHIPVTPKTK